VKSSTFSYELWIRQAQERLALLYQQQQAINHEIAQLENALPGLVPLTGQWSGPDGGLTESIRQVLRREPDRVFAPTEIRDELVKRGLVLQQQNPMAAIHQTLARLLTNREAKAPIVDGRTRYQYQQSEFGVGMTTLGANDDRKSSQKPTEMTTLGSAVLPSLFENDDPNSSNKSGMTMLANPLHRLSTEKSKREVGKKGAK